MWFLFGEVSSSSGCLGWATLFYCGTPCTFHIIIRYRNKRGTRLVDIKMIKSGTFFVQLYLVAIRMIRSCTICCGYHLESPRFRGYKDIRAMPIIFGEQRISVSSGSALCV